MSDKVYPLFKRKQKSKTDDDDCIVYLGAHVSKNSLTRSSESDTDSITKKNETKSDPSNTEPTTNEINIKKENVSFGQNDSDTDLFTYYSQEQDSIFIDDESVFHNLETTDENTNKQNSLLNEDDSDEDEDIKLIFDSRDLIEQICRKYDKIEPKKEPQEEQSPILIKDKKANHEIEVKTEAFLVESDDDSDMDVLLCSIGEEYEKKSLNENNKKASDTDDDEFGIIEEESPILVKSPVTTTKQGINVFSNFKTKTENLFGSELDSLSEDDDDNNQTKKTDLNYKKNFSSKTPVRPPIMAKNVAKEHKEIQPVKRTILLNETPNKKQKLSDGDEELFSHIERPPEKAPPPPPTSHDDDILNPIDAARKKLLQNIRKPVVLPMPIKKPGTSGITNKKTVELMIQNKFKKSSLSANNQSLSLTQGIYLARQENLIRMNQVKTTKLVDKPEMVPPCEQTTNQEIKSKKIKINDQKENESVNRPSTSNGNIQVKNKSDLMGDIMNQMNVVHAKPKEIEKKPEEEVFIFENFLHRVSMCSFSWLHEQDKYLSEFKNVAQPPVVIPSDNVGPLIDNYLSYKDYYKTMFPLLLSEIWEDIFRDWRETKNEIKLYQNSPIFLKSVDRVAKHAELIALTFQSINLNRLEFKDMSF
ncbi:unnamed protein product [Brachionus calyciflorus]|uniref:Uncharacterized protein n=1 Tax=Brachionus calyciflorus TaxID=104777 RepID=A0A813YKI1_9BILA|nr:unnamed protein product [Brachionus calyciflorus]